MCDRPLQNALSGGWHLPRSIAKVNRAMVEVAKRTIAVCDSTKFGRRSLSLIVPTSSLQYLPEVSKKTHQLSLARLRYISRYFEPSLL